MTRGIACIVSGLVALSALTVWGCATRDDSVWGRVEAIDRADLSPEPARQRDLPPVVTPGEAKQDSLDQSPEATSDGPPSD
jgi:hypothetical protein